MEQLSARVKAKTNIILSNSTSHAISNLFKAKSPIFFCLWLSAALISSALFGNLAITNILIYLKFPVTTNVRYEYEDNVNGNMATLPVIGICNRNPYRTNYSIQLIKHLIESNFNLSKTENISDLEFVNDILFNQTYEDKLKIILYMYQPSSYQNESDAKLFGSIEDLIINCKFNGVACDLKKDFKSANNYRKCYFYNLKGDKKTNVNHMDDGLLLELFTGNQEYLPAFSKGCKGFF